MDCRKHRSVKSPVRMAAVGTRPVKRNAVPLIFLLEVGEEESLVFLDRTAQRAAELIQIEFFGRSREEAARIEVGIAEELEDAIRGTGSIPTSWSPEQSDPRAFPTPPSSYRSGL